MAKLNVGDEFIVTGYAHFERCKITKVENKVYYLDNQIKMNRDLKPINSNSVTITPFSQELYDFLLAKSNIPKLLNKIQNMYKICSKGSTLLIYHKLDKLIKKIS